MDGKDRGSQDAPSLEPPALFGRKRRRRERTVQAEQVQPAAEPTVAPAAGARAVEEPTPTFADEVPIVEDDASVAAAEESLTTAPEPVARRPRGVRRPRQSRRSREQKPAAVRPPRSPRAPRRIGGVPGMVAACLTGLVVGLGTVLLTWASLGLCEVATGTTSCGDPGFFLLVAVLVAMTLVGAALLRLLGVADAGSTSFLAVGLLTVLILVFLVDVLFSWAMVVVIPLLAIGTYALSHWVTTTFTETD